MPRLYLQLVLILILVFCPSIISENKLVAQLPSPATIKEGPFTAFIPAGYVILDSQSGNLNGDKFSDLIVALKRADEDTMHNPPPKRLLYMLYGLPKGKYRLCAQNENVLFTHNMGGASSFDPFNNIVIEKNNFMVQHSGGLTSYKWVTQYTFQLAQNHKWYLNKRSRNEVYFNWEADSLQADNIKFKLIKDTTQVETVRNFGKIRFEDFDYGKHGI